MNAPPPTIRAAGSFDTPLLAGLHALCFDQAWDQPWTEKSFAEILAMPGAGGWIAAVNEEPVGFAIGRISADEAELLLLGTLPDSRRGGYGRALLTQVFQSLAKAGAKRIYLEVAAPNVVARAFYSGAGFAEVGKRPRYYRIAQKNKPEPYIADAIILSCAL
jgi:ribosomal-protein-alanine N-acetyltransferase